MKQKKTKCDWGELLERVKEELPIAYLAVKGLFIVVVFVKFCLFAFVVPTVAIGALLFLLFSALNGFRFTPEMGALALALGLLVAFIAFMSERDFDWME